MAWKKGTYLAPDGRHWIQVQRFNTRYRADTNYHVLDIAWYDKYIGPLEYHQSEILAQQDLDALAVKLNLIPVPAPLRPWDGGR